TKGGIDNNRNKGRRLERQSVMNFSLQGERLLLPTLDMDWAASYSRASEWRPNERYISYVHECASLNVDAADTYLPFVSTPNSDLSAVELKEITEIENNNREDEFGAKLSFRIPLSVIDGQKGRIRFGG